MIPRDVSVRCSHLTWHRMAIVLRVPQPELAAKITLARLADQYARGDDLLTITFTVPEHDRLTASVEAPPAEMRAEENTTGTTRDIELFLGLPSAP
jgi:hypothetical protein